MRSLLSSLAVSLCLAVAAHAQTAPVANAGLDQTVGCVGQNGTPINLNGMGSSMGSEFSYLWTAPGVTFNDPTSLTPIGVFPVGETEVTLTVTSGEASASDTVIITVSDATPPMIFASADPSLLWPPNHELHDVHVDVLVFDACDADPALELVSVASSESDNGTGDGNTTGDVQGADLGADDRDFQLRAERAGPGPGRTYSALYRVTDLALNHSDALVQVIVPHDMGHHGGLSPGDDAKRATEKQIAQARKASVKAAKLQLKAAKKAAKLAQKAYKAALRAAQ